MNNIKNPTHKPENLINSEIFSWMQEIRRHIHRYPELAFKEYRTAEYIRSKLQELGIEAQTEVAGTGVIAEIGNTKGSVGVGLRADMDGLPITEDTGLSFSSLETGIMHSCGHDGHVAILLGAAAILQGKNLPGRVRLIFQPAEECGNGAAKMVEAGVLDGLGAIFAGHIDTHYPTGTYTVDPGIICAFADPFTIYLQGKSGHAARPHEANDVVIAAAALVTSLQTLVSREVDPNHAAVITVGSMHAGETHNVIAEKAFLEGTVRSTHPEARTRLMQGLTRMTKGIASLYDIGTRLEFLNRLPAVINSEPATTIARQAALSIVSRDCVISQGLSSLGGEDFAFYLQEIDGCLVRFGAQKADNYGPSHSSTFDFDENVLATGAVWYAEVAMQYLQKKTATIKTDKAKDTLFFNTP